MTALRSSPALKISDLPPDLRVPWSALEIGASVLHVAGGEIGFPDNPRTHRTPVRALLSQRDTAVVCTPPRGESDIESFLGEVLVRLVGGVGLFATLVDLVSALAVWDTEFRREGLFDGNVYLASEESGAALLALSNTGVPRGAPRDAELDAALDLLFDLELIYRFPVALKFRGQFAAARQFRLNCWGRRLFQRLSSSGHPQDLVPARDRIRRHLAEHRELYAAHMRLLESLDGSEVPDAWESALGLPVGVLR